MLGTHNLYNVYAPCGMATTSYTERYQQAERFTARHLKKPTNDCPLRV